MAEQVNQRIENMINELEQMRRTDLYDDEEIKEISRKRKEFEYHIQRRVKQKEDFVQFIAYELDLLEDISLRRKKKKMVEKKKDIEYAIAKRLNKIFKQFIYRFQDDIEIYFEYIKFCRGVGFDYAISGIIGQMLQIHGDKPKVWQLASKWESKEQNNLDNARSFLLKGIQRHTDSEVLYLELFDIELITLTFKTESDEERETQIKRSDIVWRNGVKNIASVEFLFRLMELCRKYEIKEPFVNDIKQEIWSKRDNKRVWIYIASEELEGHHWEEIEEIVDEEKDFSKELNYYMAVYEEALQRFPDQELCSSYIHKLLGVSDAICSEYQKISAVKHAWNYGHTNGLLSDNMYIFGIEMFKLSNEMSTEELTEVLQSATKSNPELRSIWEEQILLCNANEKQILTIINAAIRALKSDNLLHFCNFVLDNVTSNTVLKEMYKKFQSCENAVVLAIKPKLLQKNYQYNGIQAARQLYEDLIRTPPTQIDVHLNMIDIEMSQENPNKIDRLIGPLELPPTLNGARFLEFLETQLSESLMELPLSYRQQMWFQLDRAPAHFSRAVREYLNENYSPWIGRGGDVAWPARSPDLTPLDYFLWGNMKQRVYATVRNLREELVAKIMSVAQDIRQDTDMVRRATAQVSQRALSCLQAGGGHFEQLF